MGMKGDVDGKKMRVRTEKGMCIRKSERAYKEKRIWKRGCA